MWVQSILIQICCVWYLLLKHSAVLGFGDRRFCKCITIERFQLVKQNLAINKRRAAISGLKGVCLFAGSARKRIEDEFPKKKKEENENRKNDKKKVSVADTERLLLSEKGLTAFIVAEMRHFVNKAMFEFDEKIRYSGSKWKLSPKEKVELGLMNAESDDFVHDSHVSNYNASLVDEYDLASAHFSSSREGSEDAINLICSTTQTAFVDGYRQSGLLSALGSAIIYFRGFYRETPTLIAACERIGLSDYDIAHHITDMYHHRVFRGAYTKTLPPSGDGEVAARIAVGLEVEEVKTKLGNTNAESGGIGKTSPVDGSTTTSREVDDKCLVWSPTTPGVCLHWKSDDDAWRQKRFERIQMEGTRDPRRGGSGTTR